MNTTEAIKEAVVSTGWQIPTDAVLKTYRGRPGCGCGCRGTYSMSKQAVTRRTKSVNEMLEFLDAGNGYSLEVTMDGVWSNWGDNGEDAVCFSVTDHLDDKTVWVYVNAAALPNVEA